MAVFDLVMLVIAAIVMALICLAGLVVLVFELGRRPGGGASGGSRRRRVQRRG